MKILNVNFSIDKVTGGGTAERTLKMSESLQQAGHECSILSLDIGDLEQTKKRLNKIDFILLKCFIKRYYLPVLSINTLQLIRYAIQKADIIHLMSHWTMINILLYYYAKKYKKPYVICPAGAMTIFGRSKSLKILYNWTIGKKIIKNASACIAITNDEINDFRQYDVDNQQIKLIPNGISADDFYEKNNRDFRKEYQLNDRPFILYIGRLNPIKGPDILLNAFLGCKKHLKNYQLVFAGPDEGIQENLQQIAKSNEVDKDVHFVGYLNQKQKSRAYHACSFVVIPSRHEAMSIVVLEAGILKKPVLLTTECGLNELGEKNVAIVKPVTENGISEGLLEMSKRLQEDASFGTDLFQYINKNYTFEIITEKFVTLYKNIVYSSTTRSN